jgi:adenylate cyclase
LCVGRQRSWQPTSQRRSSRGPAHQVSFGINLGDIIVEGDDFYGDGVNMAARLEGLAGPGGIACSAVVRHQVGNKLELEFLDYGEKSPKNIGQPVQVYFVNLAAPTNGAALNTPGTATRAHSALFS